MKEDEIEKYQKQREECGAQLDKFISENFSGVDQRIVTSVLLDTARFYACCCCRDIITAMGFLVGHITTNFEDLFNEVKTAIKNENIENEGTK